MKMSPKRSKKSDLRAKKKSSFNKRLKANSKKENRIEEKSNKFEGILNKKWKVFRVSPMYNFSRDKLKLYEKNLNEEMNSKENSTSNGFYKSKFTLNKNLRLNDQCIEALQVEVLKDESQGIYLGHFISWSSANTEGEASVSLPILLVEAKTHKIYGVHSSLCKIFDCDIQPVTFSFYALITFFVKLLETPRNNINISEAQVTMEYKVPECEANDKIKVSLFLEATTIIFALIMENLQEKYQEITTMEIIWEFYNKMLNHLYQIFQMDLMLAELHKIVFPDAFLTSDGQLKMSSDDAAISSLNVLEKFTPLDAVTNI